MVTLDDPRRAGRAVEGRIPPERVALVDLLDRLLAGGVVLTGDLVLSIADIDLVRISLRALITSVRECDIPDAAIRHEKTALEPAPKRPESEATWRTRA
jgi:hypothetical protein